MARASHYAASRGLDASRFRTPWFMTEATPQAMAPLNGLIKRPAYFANCLFIPVVDLRFDPAVLGYSALAGFDVRHFDVGVTDAKYTKVKRQSNSVMLYNVHEAVRSPWGIIVESAIDAESLRMLEDPTAPGRPMPVVSPLTALGSPQFAMLLYGLFQRIYVMYDNDKGGASATKSLLAAAERGGKEMGNAFKPLIYSGMDPNESYCMQGPTPLRRAIASQAG